MKNMILIRQFLTKKIIEEEVINLIGKFPCNEDKYANAYYTYLFNSICADVEEYFQYNKAKKNYVIKNMFIENKQDAKEFLKIITIHHTIRFISNEKQAPDNLSMYIEDLFDFTDKDQKTYKLLQKLHDEKSVLYDKTVMQLLITRFFYDFRNNPFLYAFLNFFLTQSYEVFYEKFKAFMPINIFA